MAKVSQRLWKIPGQRTKRKAWGFTLQVEGKQVKSYRADWTREEAEAELAKQSSQQRRRAPASRLKGPSSAASWPRPASAHLPRTSVNWKR